MDGDGRVDVTFVTNSDKFVYLLKNTSSANGISFSDKVAYNAPYKPGHVFIGDMNNDGKADLVVNNASDANNFSVLVNTWQDDGFPAALSAALGPTEICEGSSVVLKTNAVNGALYQWYKDGAAIAAATDSVFTATAPGRYSVRVNQNGSVATSATMIVSVKPILPAPVIGLQGGTNICLGTGVFLTSATKAGNQWYKDDLLIAGATDTGYRVVSPGTYKLMANSNGCSVASSNQITITATSFPTATITTPASVICTGDNLTLAANSSSGLTYQWYMNEEVIPGAFSSTLTTKAAGKYSVSTTNNGCSTTSQAIAISSVASPAKPTITQAGTQLTSSSAAGNQWYRDGVAIANATAQTYTPTNSGNYAVQVTFSGCKSPMSESISFVLTGIVSIDNTHFIKLSPNPVSYQMKLDFKLNQFYLLNVDLVDLNGRLIQKWSNLKDGSMLNLSSFSNGIYLARFYGTDKKIIAVIKILKQ